MAKNDGKFCQPVSQYQGKEYMIDLSVVTHSESISIPLVLYMGGGGGSATSLMDLPMTFKEYVNPIWTGLFPNMRRLRGGGAKKTFQVNFGVSRFTLEWSHCTYTEKCWCTPNQFLPTKSLIDNWCTNKSFINCANLRSMHNCV